MPSRVKLFLLTPTDEGIVTLERWAYSSGERVRPRCGRKVMRYPGMFELQEHDTHRCEAQIDRAPVPADMQPWIDGTYWKPAPSDDDVRWPTHCACGYEFVDDDERSCRCTRLYRRGDTGELVTVEDAPAGALYNARYCHDLERYTRNEPNVSLVLKTPAGEWHIDGPASNGPGWMRTGVPPEISATPSIGIGNPQKMHGWLRDGWLEIDNP